MGTTNQQCSYMYQDHYWFNQVHTTVHIEQLGLYCVDWSAGGGSRDGFDIRTKLIFIFFSFPMLWIGGCPWILHVHQPRDEKHRICPYRSTVPNSAQAPPATNIPRQFHTKCLIKHINIIPVFRSIWLPHMRKSPIPCKQRSMWFLFTVHMHIV